MRTLSIGNSFSEDATRYIHKIARADGKRVNTANLYIGGCSLERHYNNMLSGDRVYELQYNGENTHFFVSLEEALENREWDIVTLQQVSGRSFDKSSYYPYINEICDFVRKKAPSAKIYIHETWAYENGSERLARLGRFESARDMTDAVVNTYKEIAAEIGAHGIIPSGELFGMLAESSADAKIHRDTYHASLGLGRYALGLLWYHTLLGASVSENSFCDFDEPISENNIALVKKLVDNM